ncbi:hypothetical protein [Spiroplasma endosymbiont of Virgichneumon dumeticola]|uniref:hypothetical protein n=1 Tax=Spiroplasma endosymbiont of Virgichneumon dumeticola TaxID=3139323 RepID=UPI0035C886C5
MQYAYLLKYKVNYTDEIKYKVFTKIENAINFHKNYKHPILNDNTFERIVTQQAFITNYEILVMELDIKGVNNNG